jgi:hypothetical protein
MYAYHRLRWIERNLDIHTFCKGRLIATIKGKMPSALVFNRYAFDVQKKSKRRK